MILRICEIFLIFIVFSFGGWLMETILYIIRDKKAVKRGFLFGPVCPIYGFAAIMCDVILYRRINNILLLFVVGFFLSGLLEYFTHFALEKMFHAMWWDYSNRRLNIKGRVYFKGLIYFAIGVVLIVRLILPALYKLFAFVPDKAIYIVSFILYSIIIIDVATTIVDLKGAVRYIKNFQASAVEGAQKGVDLTSEQIELAKKNILESDVYKKTISENPALLRFKARYPNFTLKKYKYIIDIINDKPLEEKGRTDIKLYGTATSIPEKSEKANKESGE